MKDATTDTTEQPTTVGKSTSKLSVNLSSNFITFNF